MGTNKKDAYIHAKADKKLKRRILKVQKMRGYDNESQTTRYLVEQGLKKEGV